MAKDFRTNVEFNNSVMVSGNLTASVGNTRILSGSITNLFTASPTKINGATASDPLDVRVNTDQMIRMTTFAGYANVESTNLAGNAWSAMNVGGSQISLSTSGTNRFTIDSTGNTVLAGNLTASVGTSVFGSAVFNTNGEGIDINSSATDEGGQINFRGGTNYTGSFMQIDNYQGNLRILNKNGTAVALSISNATGNVTINGSTSLASASTNGLPIATTPSIQYSTASLQNTSTTAFVRPTGMTGITLKANTLYKYEISINYRVFGTNQIFKSKLVHPNLTLGTAHHVIGTNTTQVSYLGVVEKLNTSASTDISTTTATNSGATELIQRIDGIIQPSADGTFAYEFAPATSSAAVFSNSYIMVTPVTAV